MSTYKSSVFILNVQEIIENFDLRNSDEDNPALSKIKKILFLGQVNKLNQDLK